MEEEKEEWAGKKGREREEGGMVKLNADVKGLFFGTWQMFARVGFGEHENVKPTCKTENHFLFFNFFTLHPFQRVQNVAQGWFTL